MKETGMKKPLELFLTFAKIGLFTFGGGYAMIPLIEDICVEKKKWITEEEMLNLTVIAESTPGPIAINSATFIGARQAGIPGAVAATVGVSLPSFAIIYLISLFLDRFLEIAWVAKIFAGIKVGVGVIIFEAGLRLFRKIKAGLFGKIVTACALVLMILINLFAWNISSIVLLLAAALSGVFAMLISRTAERKGGGKE